MMSKNSVLVSLIFFAAAVLFLENRNLVKLYGGPRLQTDSFETDQIEVSPQKRSRPSKPFDPFSDFIFRAIKDEEHRHQNDPIDKYFSSYHCVASGNDNQDLGQSEQTSFQLDNERPNFVNRQCHYRNLYYNIKDQTFHYLASPVESKVLQEARKADAEVAVQSGKKPDEFLLAHQTQLRQHSSDQIPARNDLQNYMEGYEAYGSHPYLFSSYPELLNRMTVQISHVADKYWKKQYSVPWRPIVHEHNAADDLWKTLSRANDEKKTASFAVAGVKDSQGDSDDFYFSLYHPYHSMNFGHFLWDDVLAVFSLYDRLAAEAGTHNRANDDLVIPFFVELPRNKKGINYGGNDRWWRCSPGNPKKWKKCVKMYRRVYAPLTGIATDQCSGDLIRTGNWLHGDKPIGTWQDHPKNDTCLDHLDEEERHRYLNRNRLVDNDGRDINTEYVMIPNVLAGGGRLGYFGCDQDCSLGRGKEYYRFRNYVFQNVLLAESEKYDPESKTRVGYIVFSLSEDSSRADLVSHFENEIKKSIERYGKDVVKVVNLAKMTVKDQVLLLDETALLVTNHGGVSSATIFLPWGSAALIYWHGDRKMDSQWNEAAGYFRPVYLGVDERPFLNRTMAIIDDQLEKTRIEWSSKKSRLQ